MVNATATNVVEQKPLDTKRAVFAVANVAVIGLLVVLAPGVAEEFMADGRVATTISQTFSIQMSELIPEAFTTAALLAAGAYLALLAARQVNEAFLVPLMPQHFTSMSKTKVEAALHWVSIAMVSFSVWARIGTENQVTIMEWLNVEASPENLAQMSLIGCALSVIAIALIERFLMKRGVRRPLLNWTGAIIATVVGVAALAAVVLAALCALVCLLVGTIALVAIPAAIMVAVVGILAGIFIK